MQVVHVTAVSVALRDNDAIASCEHLLDLINSYVDMSSRWDVPRAARYGLLHLLQHFDRQSPSLTPHQLACAVEIAASRGHLSILEWVHTHPRDREAFTVKTMNMAAFHGHLDIVQWLHTNRSEGCTTKAMDGAACCGHLDVVRWLHENRFEGCTLDAMDSAAVNGHLDVVHYLHFHRAEGCTTRAMDVAAANADMPMLAFLQKHRSEGCTLSAVKNAASGCRFHLLGANQSVQVLQWLYDHYPTLFSPPVLNMCLRLGPVEVAAWIQSLGIVDEELFSTWLMALGPIT
ncbi:hypothetical protein Poli38472_014326 [Pythium oligandrum]|uniref:Ankyrin repeat protein n=1 Tax=Pythium oligandrum TaxID=41045 RepID=A0A8K1C799_PYTOL|nr:hypothetical protein Poli38472_014326 [Pythium oligandrum]|eukprot:TMW57723.1 hypothetical protein Poli38472_014326 [Pythium oligandrum]